ncbi:hypothetical protein V8E36_008867 [Tilletia maclaganii]
MYSERVDFTRCRWSNSGLSKCHANAVCTVSSIRPPHVLFVSLPAQPDDSEKCWSSSDEIEVCGIRYRLAGRIVALNERGSHFTLLTHLPSALGPYSQAGIYAYDDMAGVAPLRRGNTAQAFVETLARVPFSNTAVFVALTAIGDPLAFQVPTIKATTSQARTRTQLKVKDAVVLGLQRYTPSSA